MNTQLAKRNLFHTTDYPTPYSNKDRDCKRKWNEKGKVFKKGRITKEEGIIITNSLCNYAYEHEIKHGSILNLIVDKQKKQSTSIWPMIAECLPNRSVQSIHNYCHRQYHPYNHKGKWSEEEIGRLKDLKSDYGKKWKLIGESLGRTDTNIKDKYKHIGGDNHHNTIAIKEITFRMKLSLLLAIDDVVKDKGDGIFLYSPLFVDPIEIKDKNILIIDEAKGICCIDSEFAEEKSRSVIRNIYRQILNYKGIENIIKNKTEIPWSIVSNKLKALSVDECRNEWNKFLREINMEEDSKLRKDYKMLKKIKKMEIESIEDIRWDNIRNSRKEEENKQCLKEYMQSMQEFSKDSANTADLIDKLLEIIESKIMTLQSGKGYDNRQEEPTSEASSMPKIESIYIQYLKTIGDI